MTMTAAVPSGAVARDRTSPFGTLEGLALTADGNRDGRVDLRDWYEAPATWSWRDGGAFVLANLDDDDRDGRRDCDDDRVNGPDDEADLATLCAWVGDDVFGRTARLRLSVTAGADHVRVFDGADRRALDLPVDLSRPAPKTVWLVEARRYAGRGWNGRVGLQVEALAEDGAVVARAAPILRVAPWVMLPNSAPTAAVHVATGRYANGTFLDGLRRACTAAGAELRRPYATDDWKEMWMQDTMEIGYSQLPGRPPVHVVLRANRNGDRYPGTLLGPGMGYLVVGRYRALSGGDQWADWYGNLAVSHPVPKWPLGRIYYGRNVTTGVTLHPEVVEFVVAQEVQAPFWVDTSWLVIKHVDEILTWVPAPDGTARLCVASPRRADALVPGQYGPYNKGIQAAVDTMLDGGTYVVGGVAESYPGVLALLGLARTAVIELPVLYTNGHPDWSSPINSLFLNGTVVAGNAYVPAAVKKAVEGLFGGLGHGVAWVDDKVYQDFSGNVHCATNTTRRPLAANYLDCLPPSLP